MIKTTIRKANSDDVKDILRLLIELAIYEKEPDAVKLTEQELIRDGFGENPKYQCILAETDYKSSIQSYSSWYFSVYCGYSKS